MFVKKKQLQKISGRRTWRIFYWGVTTIGKPVGAKLNQNKSQKGNLYISDHLLWQMKMNKSYCYFRHTKKRVIVTLSTFKSMTFWLGRLITYIQGNNHRTIFRRWPYSYKLFKEFIQLFYFLIAVPITAWRTGQVERKGKTHKPLAFFSFW